MGVEAQWYGLVVVVDKTYAQVKTEHAKVEQKAVGTHERNSPKAARFEECAVEIAKAIQNILKALDIAERAMLTLKMLKYINQKKVIAERVKEGRAFLLGPIDELQAGRLRRKQQKEAEQLQNV